MQPLSDTQAAFAAALLDAGKPVPQGVKSYLRSLPEKRFNVYRNNVYASLIDVLEGRFPVVARLLGEAFFRATAKAYVSENPPVSPVLMRYGTSFADFLDGFEPVAELPYLSDVARLEWAWNLAYHAADAEPVSPEALAALPAEQTAQAVFAFHPSLHVIRSQWPVATILEVHGGEGEPEPIDAGAGGEDALVIRPHLSVEVRRLPEGGADFIDALQKGTPLEQAAESASAGVAAFDLTRNLAGLFQSGAVTGIRKNQRED